MASPLDSYDLPDIDSQLSDSEVDQAEDTKIYEDHPLKESASGRKLSKTESLHELERKITQDNIPQHDFVNPVGHEQNALFPEEYQVETDTGLVRSTTALSLQKSRTKSKAKADDGDRESGLTKAKLDKAVERNRRALQKQKTGKGFFHKFKSIFA